MNDMAEPFICYQSKTKTVLLLAGTVAFVVVSFGLIGLAYTHQYADKWLIYIFSIIAILFFGSIGIYGSTRLKDKKPLVIVDQQGIYNHTNACGEQRVLWSEITGIETAQMKGSKFLLIYVSDPQKFILNGNKFQKILMQLNAKTYGTPVSLTTQNLKCKYVDLLAAIDAWHDEYMQTEHSNTALDSSN